MSIVSAFLCFEIYLRVFPSDSLFDVLIESDLTKEENVKKIVELIKSPFIELDELCIDENKCVLQETLLSFIIGQDGNNLLLISTLIDHGVNIELADMHHQTPIMVAANMGYTEIVLYLIISL